MAAFSGFYESPGHAAHFNASALTSKWPAAEVHSFVAAGFIAWHNNS
jgi:hypothetical protein